MVTTTAVIDLLGRLVAFDTTSRNSNLPFIEFVRGHLATLGVSAELTADPGGGKANLFASIGPDSREGGIVLSGHTDVVPVDGQPWSSDPFAVRAENGRLYGRGTCDMKGFIAIVLALLPELIRRQPRVPVHLAFTYDEEVNCAGAIQLVARMRSEGYRPAAVIIGEPTGMKVMNAHKGHYAYRTRVRGREAHSSLPDSGASAIAIAVTLIDGLLKFADAQKAAADPDNGFTPPWPTLNIGVIAGGTAMNIIPRECSFEWDWRPISADAPEAAREHLKSLVTRMLPELRARHPEVAIETERTLAAPPLAEDRQSAAQSLALGILGSNETLKASYGTDGSIFQRGGMPVIVCGPGSIEQAHKPDEFVEISELEACMRFLRGLMDRICTH